MSCINLDEWHVPNVGLFLFVLLLSVSHPLIHLTLFDSLSCLVVEPIRLGHYSVDSVHAMEEKLLKAGCLFKKKTSEGRMSHIAFVYDADKYWVELVGRGEGHNIKCEANFSQTMLRIKDPKKSLEFYGKLGMKLLKERHLNGFSLYFLGSSNVPDDAHPSTMFQPCLELTHNHGTEDDEDFKHYNGNEEGRQGFGHIGKSILVLLCFVFYGCIVDLVSNLTDMYRINGMRCFVFLLFVNFFCFFFRGGGDNDYAGFLVDDVYKACDGIREMGYGFKKVRRNGHDLVWIGCR